MSKWLCAFVAMFLAACASSPPAPVEDRSGRPGAVRKAPSGHYVVNRGDTLYAIAFTHGLDYRQLAAWNGLRSPYVIYPGQQLRLTADRPAAGADKQAAKVSTAPIRTPSAVSSAAAEADKKTVTSTQAKPEPKPTVQPSAQSAAHSTAQPSAGDPSAWRWPVEGRIVRGFLASDPSRNGIDIAAGEGQAVEASASGTVVYSGNGLIGYGELIIIKHSERMLSAYAHNRKRLVAEGDSVKAGQKIAELGRNDHNEAILHFEIRVNGKPVNPLEHLPRR